MAEQSTGNGSEAIFVGKTRDDTTAHSTRTYDDGLSPEIELGVFIGKLSVCGRPFGCDVWSGGWRVKSALCVIDG